MFGRTCDAANSFAFVDYTDMYSVDYLLPIVRLLSSNLIANFCDVFWLFCIVIVFLALGFSCYF